jgi:hypothetical protein
VTPITDRARLRTALLTRTFGGWPERGPLVKEVETVKAAGGREVRLVRFNSEDHIRLRLYYILPSGNPSQLRLRVLTADEVPEASAILADLSREADRYPDACAAVLLTRELGESAPAKAIQVRRRYMLLGQTLDGMRVWDIERGMELLRAMPDLSHVPVTLSAKGRDAANIVMSAFVSEQPLAALELSDVPGSEADEPDYLNYRRFTTLSDIIEMLGSEIKVRHEPGN